MLLAEALKENEAKIIEELLAVEGKPTYNLLKLIFL